ncbi:MAG: ATP-binding protein [Muribaculaceae bacterium]|nr:ATP-binding protein [Muribaculaceae bacterium]
MIDKRVLELVLTEQRNEILNKKKLHFCYRKEEELVNLNSNKAQVVIGVRRSGKSTMCYTVLHRAGVKFAYVNFDDERFLDISADDLNNILEVLYKINGTFTHLFMDEVQNVDGWHLFVNRLLRQGMKVIITGSNAKLLSSELATHLTGRHSTIELFPFSFSEYCTLKGVDTQALTTVDEATRRSAFDKYIKSGGFPEIVIYGDERGYINNLVNDILQRDIKNRYNIKFFAVFEKFAHHLMNIAPTIISTDELATTFNIKSELTIRNYIKHLTSAYLLLNINKFSPKSKLRVRNNKVYTVDVAIMNNRVDAFASENMGWRLETIVYVQLLRIARLNYHDVYYYKKNSRAKEVDFVVCHDNKVLQLLQVAYDISNPKTKKREIDSLLEASSETGCKNLYLITDHERESLEIDGVIINIIPAYEWLLSSELL